MTELENIYSQTKIRYASNEIKLAPCDYPEELNTVFDRSMAKQAIAEITKWPGYQPTPLHSLQDVAQAVGIEAIYYKDEAHRFGLGSFKALGGSYSVLCLLREQISKKIGRDIDFEEVKNGKHAEIIRQITVTSATDGNHGRSVAWGAQLFGCRCVIFIHAEVSESRKQAMESYGAQVIRVEGNYDDSVDLAAKTAEEKGWFVTSDTSYEGYVDPPRNVMAGYCVMLDEMITQLEQPSALTHVIIQGGCGGLASAVNAYLWQQWGAMMPRFVIVEPHYADCLYQSAINQNRTYVNIQEESLMAGLSCGEVSMIGWQIMEKGISDFLTIDEDVVAPTMKLLAKRSEKIIAGESAIAGLAALMACSKQDQLFDKLGLDHSSQVLLLGTEGATDPVIYQQLTGLNPDY